MPIFTPPTRPDIPMAVPDGPAWKLFRHYAVRESGVTVWKDENDVWHEALYPDMGGDISRYYDWDTYTATSPRPGLATAKKVYLGGHAHHVSSADAAELTVAGYGAYLNTEEVNLIWTEEDIAHLTNKIASPGVGEIPQTPFIDGEQCINFPLDQPTPGFSSGRRDYWVHDDTSGWTDVYFEILLNPNKFGLQPGPPEYDVLPQTGVCLRRQFSNGKWRAVTINNNIFLRLAFPNIGVWEMNEDGSGFLNRQFSYEVFDSHAQPYHLAGFLIDNIVTITTYPENSAPQWSNPKYTKVIDLDVDAGNSATIPTPTGTGECGVVAAHSSANPEGYCRIGRTLFRRLL